METTTRGRACVARALIVPSELTARLSIEIYNVHEGLPLGCNRQVERKLEREGLFQVDDRSACWKLHPDNCLRTILGGDDRVKQEATFIECGSNIIRGENPAIGQERLE